MCKAVTTLVVVELRRVFALDCGRYTHVEEACRAKVNVMAQPLPQNLLEEYGLEEVAAAWTEGHQEPGDGG